MKEFDINGVIVATDDAWIYDWYELENTSPKKLKNFLDDAAGEDVLININSGGGDLYSGVNMHDMLKSYSGNVEIHIVGLAASAASVIAMSGKCLMSPGSQMMIHNVSCCETSNKNGKAKMAKDLSVCDKGVAAVYEAKSGISQDELLKLMDKETWLDAKTALEMKLIDGILGVETAPAFTNSITAMLPETVLAKARQLAKTSDSEARYKAPASGVRIDDLLTKLNYLRR